MSCRPRARGAPPPYIAESVSPDILVGRCGGGARLEEAGAKWEGADAEGEGESDGKRVS